MKNSKDARILIVDDQLMNIRLLELILKSEGYYHLKSTTHPNQVMGLFEEFQPDLILLDLYMPELDGFAVLKQLESLIPSSTYLPILVLTADITQETRNRSLSSGAKDFLTKPLSTPEVLLRIKNMLETRLLYLQQQYHNNILEDRVRERTRELERKAEQLSMSSRYKSEFLANMSHELRTPLNSMLILSKLLADNKEGNLTSKQVQYASTVYSSGNDLLYLINEILDLTKVESGKMEVNASFAAFSSIVQFSERNFQPLAQKKGLEFLIKLESGLPETLYTDQQLLQQILRNLLSNAFKFTSQGSVIFEIKAISFKSFCQENNVDSIENMNCRILLEKSEQIIAFIIKDTGIGIPGEKQEIIFEAFLQADGKSSRKFGGTGLGLSISPKLAHLLGGVVKVVSMEGEGSQFTLYLPDTYISTIDEEDAAHNLEMLFSVPLFSREATAASDVEDVAAIGTEHSGRLLHQKVVTPEPQAVDPFFKKDGVFLDKKILLVDDDIRNVYALTSVLENYSMQIIFAENGRIAIELLEKAPKIDLVLMDIMMPEMDGYEAMRRIRNIPRFQVLPIIALTAQAMKDDKEKCINAGASDYIDKPINTDQLLSLMQVWLYK